MKQHIIIFSVKELTRIKNLCLSYKTNMEYIYTRLIFKIFHPKQGLGDRNCEDLSSYFHNFP